MQTLSLCFALIFGHHHKPKPAPVPDYSTPELKEIVAKAELGLTAYEDGSAESRMEAKQIELIHAELNGLDTTSPHYPEDVATLEKDMCELVWLDLFLQKQRFI